LKIQSSRLFCFMTRKQKVDFSIITITNTSS